MADVRRKIEAIPEVPKVEVELVWYPPWTRERLSDEAAVGIGADVSARESAWNILRQWMVAGSPPWCTGAGMRQCT